MFSCMYCVLLFRGWTLHGATRVRRGLVAADPRVLPMGSRIFVNAGSWEWDVLNLVSDTGGAIRRHDASTFGAEPHKNTPQLYDDSVQPRWRREFSSKNSENRRMAATSTRPFSFLLIARSLRPASAFSCLMETRSRR